MTLVHLDMGLPRSYDQWRTAGPDDYVERPCTCGHTADDHEDIKDPDGYLLLIRKLSDKLAHHFSEFRMTADGDEVRALLNEADLALASCQVEGCDCRGFVESDDDDLIEEWEPEFDEAPE